MDAADGYPSRTGPVLKKFRTSPRNGCGPTITTARIWPWAVSPQCSTWPRLHNRSTFRSGGNRGDYLGGLGVVAMACGVFLIAGGPGLFKGTHSLAQAQRIRKGMLYGLLTGVFIASYTVVDGYAVKVALMSPILVDYMGNFVRLGLLLPAMARDTDQVRGQWKLQWKHAAVVGVISPISYVLVLYAMQVAPLSHVAPAREVSMLFAALIGGHLLGEGDRVLRLVGAASMAIGVMALALS